MLLNLKGRRSTPIDPEDILVQNPYDNAHMDAQQYLDAGAGEFAAGASGTGQVPENPLSPEINATAGVDITNPPLTNRGRDINTSTDSQNPILAPLVNDPPALINDDVQYATIGQLETAKIQGPVTANQPTVQNRVMPIQAQAVAPTAAPVRVTQLFTRPAVAAPARATGNHNAPIKVTGEKKSSKPAAKPKPKPRKK